MLSSIMLSNIKLYYIKVSTYASNFKHSIFSPFSTKIMILTSLLFTFACSSSGYLHSFNVNLVRKRSEMSLKRLFKVFKRY